MNLCIIFILIEIHLLSAEDGLEFINNTNFSSDVNRWFIFAYLFRTLVLQLTTFILVVYLAYVTEKNKSWYYITYMAFNISDFGKILFDYKEE